MQLGGKIRQTRAHGDRVTRGGVNGGGIARLPVVLLAVPIEIRLERIEPFELGGVAFNKRGNKFAHLNHARRFP